MQRSQKAAETCAQVLPLAFIKGYRRKFSAWTIASANERPGITGAPRADEAWRWDRQRETSQLCKIDGIVPTSPKQPESRCREIVKLIADEPSSEFGIDENFR